MYNYLALSIPGYNKIDAPDQVPTGGLSANADVIANIITILFVTAIVVALFVLILAGIQWITSGGDKQKIESARHRIIYAIIGLIVVFLSFMIVNVIGTLFGVELLNPSVNPAASSKSPKKSGENDRKNDRQKNRNNRRDQRNGMFYHNTSAVTQYLSYHFPLSRQVP